MVEQAKELLERLFDEAESKMGVSRLPVSQIQHCAVVGLGTKIPRHILRQARKELGIESYRIGETQYWERRKEHEDANSQ